jgi:uncharacterized protein
VSRVASSVTDMRRLSIHQARRLALGAQGFARPRPAGRVDVRHLRRVLGLNAVVQLDSVNVSARAHYLPFFSRLGSYDTDRLDDWLWRSGENFEYWGHEASVMPLEVHRLMRHRMTTAHRWTSVQRLAEEHPGYIEEVRREVAELGPLSVSDLREAGSRLGSWWGWNIGRVALEWLYVSGELAIAERDRQFTLHYDLAERVLPADVLAQPPATREQAYRQLVLLAARAQGVGTAKDLADHFRLSITEARAAVAMLAAEGALEEVEVDGWSQPAFLHPEATLPRRIEARALLSPFDPVVWNRERALRLFGFHYRIEIYVPREQRRHGYYVLPFLLDDRLVARVDLKSDRRAGVLRVLSAHAEDGVDRVRVGRELATELATFASWQGLGDVAVHTAGDLAPALRRAVG